MMAPGHEEMLYSHTNDYENTTWTPEKVAEYLSQLSEDSFHQRYPVIAYLSLMMIGGIIGNVLVLTVYGLRFPPSATRVFVLSMGVCDLITNVFALPLQLATIRFAYNTYSNLFCRGYFAFSLLPTQASGALLALVSLDRYHRICRPLDAQMNSRQAWLLVLGTTVVGVLVFAPFVPLYGTHTHPTPHEGVYASMCWNGDAHKDTPYFLVYVIMVGIVFFGELLVMGVAYGLIGKRVWEQTRKRRMTMQQQQVQQPAFSSSDDKREKPTPSSGNQRSDPDESTTCSRDQEDQSQTQPTSSTDVMEANTKWGLLEGPDTTQKKAPALTLGKDAAATLQGTDNDQKRFSSLPAQIKRASNLSPNRYSWSRDRNPNKKPALSRGAKTVARQSTADRSRNQRGRKIRSQTTLMMAALTGLYVVNWLPHLIMRFLDSSPVNLCDDLTRCGWNTHALATRSFYINSAVNALVYGFCNGRFRLQCRLLFRSLFKRDARPNQ